MAGLLLGEYERRRTGVVGRAVGEGGELAGGRDHVSDDVRDVPSGIRRRETELTHLDLVQEVAPGLERDAQGRHHGFHPPNATTAPGRRGRILRRVGVGWPEHGLFRAAWVSVGLWIGRSCVGRRGGPDMKRPGCR
jgi:hypothetical protein